MQILLSTPHSNQGSSWFSSLDDLALVELGDVKYQTLQRHGPLLNELPSDPETKGEGQSDPHQKRQ